MIRPQLVEEPTQRPGDFSPIVRPRVLERIAAAARQRVALVVAPAGCGKSVAVHHYLDTVRKRVIHYDLRPEHGTLLGFVRGFAEAIEPHAPDALHTVSGAYEKNQASSDPVAGLAIWLSAHLHDFSAIIAIDDLHLAESTPAVSGLIEALVARCREQSWIIVSRSFCDLPVGTWFASGVIGNVVTENDLSFGLDEANAAARAVHTSLSTDAIVDIATATGGWAAALSIALRTSSSAGDIKRSSATRDLLYRYLAEQVYRTLSEREREILELCCLEPSVGVHILKQMGYLDSKPTLDRLAKIAPTSSMTPDAFRCHDLFRDFVLFRLDADHARASSICIRLGKQLQLNGNASAASALYLRAKATRDQINLLHTDGRNLLELARADVVSAALESITDVEMSNDASLLALKAAQAANNGQIVAAEALYQRAAAATSDKDLLADFAINLGIMRLNLRRNVEGELRSALDSVPPKLDQRTELLALLAFSAAINGHIERASALISECLVLLPKLKQNAVRAKVTLRIGATYSEMGWYSDCIVYLKEAVRLAHENGLLSLASRGLQIQGGAMRWQGANNEAIIDLMEASFECAKRAGDTIAAQTALLWNVDLALDACDFSIIDASLARLKDFPLSDAGREACKYEPEIYRAILNDDFPKAVRYAREVLPHLAYTEDYIIVSAGLAVSLALNGDMKKSAEAVSETLERLGALTLQSVRVDRHRGQAYVLLAVAVFVAQKRSESRKYLVAAIETDLEEIKALGNGVNDFLANGATVESQERARKFLAVLPEVGLGRSLVFLNAAFRRIGAERGTVQLTASERQVLEQLLNGVAPKEIASVLGRSVFTVRTHIRKMIEKFGCSGTLELISIARSEDR